MTIINHGSWTRYVPENPPAALPSGMSVMFCRRDSDGVDWYDYIYQSGSVFAPGSIKMTVLNGVVQAVARDEDRLFPQSSLLLELTGDDAEDPQTKYGQWLYDDAANTIAPAPPPSPVPVSVTPAQGRIALLNAGLLDQAQAAVDAAGGAVEIWWEYAPQWERNNSIVEAIGAALGLTSDQIDQLFMDAAQIN